MKKARIPLAFAMVAALAWSAWAGTVRVGRPTVDGDEYIFPVYLDSTPGEDIGALNFNYVYDPAQMEPVGAVAGTAATSSGKDVASNLSKPGNYVVLVMGMNTNSVKSGQVAQIRMRKIGSNEGTSVSITGTKLAAVDGSAEIPSKGSKLDFKYSDATPAENENTDENTDENADEEEAETDQSEESADESAEEDSNEDAEGDVAATPATAASTASGASNGAASTPSAALSKQPSAKTAEKGKPPAKGQANSVAPAASRIADAAARARAGLPPAGGTAPSSSKAGKPGDASVVTPGAAPDTNSPGGTAPSGTLVAKADSTEPAGSGAASPQPPQPGGEETAARQSSGSETARNRGPMLIFMGVAGIVVIGLFFLRRKLFG